MLAIANTLLFISVNYCSFCLFVFQCLCLFTWVLKQGLILARTDQELTIVLAGLESKMIFLL